MPDAFDDLGALYDARPPRRRMRLPPGWADPDQEEIDREDRYGSLDNWRQPSVLYQIRGGIFDPDIDELEFFQRLKGATDEAPKPGMFERMATRIAPAAVGSVTGAAIGGAVAGPPGAFVGGVMGGFGGGSGGEYLAEDVERMHGERKDISGRQVLMQGALNALPLGKPLSIGREALKGAGMGLASAELSALAEDRNASLEEFLYGAGLGGASSAALAALFGRHAPPGDEVLEGQVIPPRRSTYETGLGPPRRPRRPPDIDADFYSWEGPVGPGGGGGGPRRPLGGYLDDPTIREGEILPDEPLDAFLRGEPKRLPPGPDDLEQLMGGERPRPPRQAPDISLESQKEPPGGVPLEEPRGDIDEGPTEIDMGGGFAERLGESEQEHNERLFQHILEDARRQGLDPATEADIRARFDRAVRSHGDWQHEMAAGAAEDASNPDTLLKAIHDAGGLYPDEVYQPMSKGGNITTRRRLTGEIKQMMEGARFGRLGDYQLIRRPDRGETSFRQQGLTWDGMREALSQQPGFENITGDLNAVMNAVGDA